MAKIYFHDSAESGWRHAVQVLELDRLDAPNMISLMKIAFMTGIVYAGTHQRIIGRITEEAEEALMSDKLFESNKEDTNAD